MHYEQAVVVRNDQLGEGHFLLELELPGLETGISAGRFINLRCTEDGRHDLLRPFSILGINESKTALLVYVKALGRGSTLLGEVPVGTKLDCLYPLGREFPRQPEWQRVALVGGGVGIAPLLYLAEELAATGGCQVQAFFGGGTEADLVPELLRRYQLPMELATMDGSRGFHGNAVEMFRDHVAEFDVVYSCGPNAMMQALQNVVPATTPAFASLEEHMACGVGACLGCVVKVGSGDEIEHLTVCKEGPVFNLHRVQFA